MSLSEFQALVTGYITGALCKGEPLLIGRRDSSGRRRELHQRAARHWPPDWRAAARHRRARMKRRRTVWWCRHCRHMVSAKTHPAACPRCHVLRLRVRLVLNGHGPVAVPR